MKHDKAPATASDANSVLSKHLSAAQRKRRKRRVTVIVVTVVILAAIAAVVISLRQSVSERYGSSESSVESAQVTVGSVSTTVSGTGTLADDDVEDVELPAAIEIDTLLVEQGDTVAEGGVIATVDTASVVSAMADIQDQLDGIDAELAQASGDTVNNRIVAGIAGRVKKIYAAAGDDVATVMYDNGALMLISLDGLMAADIATQADAAAGDAVTVTLSDGSTVDGTVEKVKDGVATVTVSDNGPAFSDTVTVTDDNGGALGTGTLYIHSELKITGYAGTVSKVAAAENKAVSASAKLLTLTDTSYTAQYDALLKQRAVLEDDLDELIRLYKQGAVYSPISGVIYSVNDDEDGDSADAASAAAANAQTADASADTGASDDPVTVVTVCPNATMSVTVGMDESDILSLAVGQEAAVTIDSIGDDEFTGLVTGINTSGVSSGGVTVYTVEVTIDKTDQMLAGMSASVDIRIEGVDNALLVPEDAVSQTSSTAYVYTEYNTETEELGGMVEVTTGLSNGTYVEITSGLNEGDTVYYDASADEDEPGFGFGGMPGGESGRFPGSGQYGGMPGAMPGQ